MKKRGGYLLIISGIFIQVFLLICSGFVFSVLISGNFVSAQESSGSGEPIKSLTSGGKDIGDLGGIPGAFLDPVVRGLGYTASKISSIEVGSKSGGGGIVEGFSNLLGFSSSGDRDIWAHKKTGDLYELVEKFDPGQIYEGKYKNIRTGGEELIIKGELKPGSTDLAEAKKFGPFSSKNPYVGHLLEGLGQAFLVVGAIQLIGGIAGFDSKQTNAASIASIAGIMSYKTVQGGIQSGALTENNFLAKNAGVVSFGVALLVFAYLYSDEKKEIVQFQCLPWEPPRGGQNCEACNDDPLRPCSEYRCKSLGQSCGLVNEGTLDEKCIWVSPNDVTSPMIRPWSEELKPRDLEFTNVNIRPPSLGAKIQRSGGNCLQAFTALEFGIVTDEPAQCKIDYQRTENYEEMQFYFGENNLFVENHTQRMKLPGPDSFGDTQSPILENDGTFTLYTRCIDANENVNEEEFAINFCVDPAPDTTPPVIDSTSIESGSPVSFEADTVPIEVYVNEPAECKWSRQSKSFDDMENPMSCGTSFFEVNADLLYTCSADLTGIKDKADNDFFFRCKDQPGKADEERNVNVQSYELTLRGSQKLNILEIGPNETVSGSTLTVPITLEVKTDDGANEGKAFCYFSPNEDLGSFVEMFETNSHLHRQTLDLIGDSSGVQYEYFFRCIDAGGNSASGSTEFTVISDKQAPQVARVYREEGLKVVTDEDALCKYSLSDCNFVFDEGINMIYSNPSILTSHFAEWDPSNTYHVKCKDEFGNEPGPNDCSVIVRAFEIDDIDEDK